MDLLSAAIQGDKFSLRVGRPLRFWRQCTQPRTRYGPGVINGCETRLFSSCRDDIDEFYTNAQLEKYFNLESFSSIPNILCVLCSSDGHQSFDIFSKPGLQVQPNDNKIFSTSFLGTMTNFYYE